MDTRKRILLVDDEQINLEFFEVMLGKLGFETEKTDNGADALELVKRFKPDLIILDNVMPRLSGWEVTKILKTHEEYREFSETPIIMFSAMDDVKDKVEGLEMGADDYITKPFSPREVVARVRAVLRRGERAAQAESVTSVGDMVIDRDRRTVSVAGQDAELTRTEFDILSVMAETPGRVFTRLQLLQTASGDAFDGYERTVDAHVKNLRRKLGDDPRAPRFIRTVYGVGYKVDPQ